MTHQPGIAVVIPHHPKRPMAYVDRAVASVHAQTLQPNTIRVLADTKLEGAAATRNRALLDVDTPWVAFLDDDDEMLPQHLERLWQRAEWGIYDDIAVDGITRKKHVAPAMVWSYFIVPEYAALPPTDPRSGWNGGDPLQSFGFTEPQVDVGLARNHVPCGITGLFNMDALRTVELFPLPNTPSWPHPAFEDLGLYKKLRAAGYRFAHVPEVTHLWHAHKDQTRGIPGGKQ